MLYTIRIEENVPTLVWYRRNLQKRIQYGGNKSKTPRVHYHLSFP